MRSFLVLQVFCLHNCPLNIQGPLSGCQLSLQVREVIYIISMCMTSSLQLFYSTLLPIEGGFLLLQHHIRTKGPLWPSMAPNPYPSSTWAIVSDPYTLRSSSSCWCLFEIFINCFPLFSLQAWNIHMTWKPLAYALDSSVWPSAYTFITQKVE